LLASNTKTENVNMYVIVEVEEMKFRVLELVRVGNIEKNSSNPLFTIL
jgi:hypothetical protein